MSGKFHVGLDIGSNSIKAAFLSTTKTGFVLEQMHSEEFSGAATENGSVLDYGELVDRVSKVVDDRFSVKEVAIALKGPSVLVRKMLVNNDSLGDLGEFRWIANQYSCIEPEEMSVDFETLPSHDLYNHTGIVMTAAKKDVIIDFVSILESADLIPKVIESEAMSIIRLFRCTNNGSTGINMILHVGYAGSFIILIKNGFFEFCREVSRGGKYFTEMIKHDLEVNSETAETIKINPEEHSDPQKVRTTLDRIFSIEYIQEVDYALKFYLLRGGSLPEQIYLSGGACQTFGVEKCLRDKYNVPISFLNPWDHIIPSSNVEEIKENDKYSYNVALGLALHGLIY